MSYDVLIVDDSEITRTALERMLRLAGLELGRVCTAGNGSEALAVLEDQWVDLVLMDLNMPGMTGSELVDHMATAGLLDETPVVVISSERRAERVAALRAKGVRAFIPKPLRPEQLRDVVVELLGVDHELV